MSLGTIMIFAVMFFVLIIKIVDKEVISIYYVPVFGFLLIGATYLLGLIPFGQVVESLDDKTFTTYYKLGRLKFKQQKWDKAHKVSMEQDKRKYYCLTIRTINGQTLHMEKYSTLSEANERLIEFKKLFE